MTLDAVGGHADHGGNYREQENQDHVEKASFVPKFVILTFKLIQLCLNRDSTRKFCRFYCEVEVA